MIPTIYHFTRALLHAAKSLPALTGAHVVTNEEGVPLIRRTSRFAEAEIEWQAERWLLCMPLTSAAVPEIERTAVQLKTLRSEWLAEYRLLRNAMRYENSMGAECFSDLILQHLPAGRTFAEALTSEPTERLLTALDALEAEFIRLGISHRNLKSENLRWCNGRLIPIRYHHARTEAGGDAAAIALLRAAICRQTMPLQTVNDTTAHYESPIGRFTGHRWVGHTFEQLILVEDEAGYGYVDTQNRTVIPAQYLWADDFHEGRAAVETAEGMGLIDKQGHYIIPAHYEIVEYNPATGCSEVRQNGLWAEFDYTGQQLGEFAERTTAWQ